MAGTEVAAAGDGETADTLVELPFTGAEPQVTLVALLILVMGVWLVQRSGTWQLRLARQAGPVVAPPGSTFGRPG